MSLHSYMVSFELARQDPPFSALIMAAMRKADTRNKTALMAAFPEIWVELQARYNAPGGRLDGEGEADPDVKVEIVMAPGAQPPVPVDLMVDPDCRDGKHPSCVGGPCECVCHGKPEPFKDAHWADRLPIPAHIQVEIDKLHAVDRELFMLPNPDHVQGEPIISAAGRAEMAEGGLAMAARVLKPSAFERLTGTTWQGTPEQRVALEATGEDVPGDRLPADDYEGTSYGSDPVSDLIDRAGGDA